MKKKNPLCFFITITLHWQKFITINSKILRNILSFALNNIVFYFNDFSTVFRSVLDVCPKIYVLTSI